MDLTNRPADAAAPHQLQRSGITLSPAPTCWRSLGAGRIDVGRSRVTLPLVGAFSYGLLHPWTCHSSHRRSSWWCLLPSSCWSPRWCLLPSASGLTEEYFRVRLLNFP